MTCNIGKTCEPEILDELGIMVRLDKASEDYARSLNKTVGELTQFEKRMAFTNAIIEQGRQKFDGITDSIDASPFSKLSASLSDLAKTAIGGLNKALGPMANFLAENTFALGALVALSSTADNFDDFSRPSTKFFTHVCHLLFSNQALRP